MTLCCRVQGACAVGSMHDGRSQHRAAISEAHEIHSSRGRAARGTRLLVAAGDKYHRQSAVQPVDTSS